MVRLSSSARLVGPGLGLVLLFAASAFAFGADSVAASLVISALILALVGIGLIAGVIDLPRVSFALAGAYLVFLLIAAWRGWLVSGLGEYASLAAAGAVVLMARSGAVKLEQGRRLWSWTLILGGSLALISILQFSVEPAAWFGQTRPFHTNRLAGPFLSANTAATFFAMIALLALASVCQQWRRIEGPGAKRWVETGLAGLTLPLSVTVLALACVLMSASRAGVLLCLGAGCALLIWDTLRQPLKSGKERRSWTPRLTGLGLGLTALVLLLPLTEVLGVRLERVGNDTATRSLMFSAYWDATGYAALFGHGLGGFRFINDLVADAHTAPTLVRQSAAHNVYLQWLLQAGWLGALVMFGTVAGMIASIWAGLARRRRGRTELRAVLAVTVLVAAHGLVDFALEIPGVLWLFAWMLGLGLGFARSEREAAASRPAPAWRFLAVQFGFGLLALAVVFGWNGINHARAGQVMGLDEAGLARIAETSHARPGFLARRQALADRALQLGIEPELAASLYEDVLAAEPRDGDNWARLAYARFLAGENAAGVDAALAQSYWRKPYANAAFRRWRLAFASQVWRQLSPSTRAAVLRELRLEPEARRARWMEALVRATPD